jgi:hypothetical protein
LVVVAGTLLALAIVQRDRALRQVYDDAQDRAELYAGTVLRSSLSAADVARPLAGDRYRSLLAEVQAIFLTDPTVARVRLWGPDGTLLFSTDDADQKGEVAQDAAIDVAGEGDIGSRLRVEELSRSSIDSATTPTPLFQTFAPLRVRNDADVVGAVEIEQFAAALEDRADDPWSIVQTVATAVTALLALMALVSVVRGMRHTPPANKRRASREDRERRRWPRRRDLGLDAETDALRERLERATARAQKAEDAARSFAARLQQVTRRLEGIEQKSSDDRVDELKEALRRSEAERAMLRSGRPETVLEAQVRELRRELREAQSLAKAAEALVAGGGDLSAVQEQLSAAARQVETALERAQAAEGRADAAEERAQSAGDMATAAEQRIDLLEAKLQEIAATGVGAAEPAELVEVRRLLADANKRVVEMEQRATEAETQLAAATVEAPAHDLLLQLEERVLAAERRASEAETRVRSFEELEAEGGAIFRQRLGRAASRKLVAAQPAAPAPEPDHDLQTSIARGLRGPLTRATGLALSLQANVESSEGRAILRQLSASLRRLDQLAADLHDVNRIADGSLPLNRRRTELSALVAGTVEEADHVEDRLIRLDTDKVHALVDPARVRQIVEGMLGAAKERTRAGAAIVVRVRNLETGARISVEDDNRTPATIGPEISLAARLAELHGTEITADGSSLRVMFPKDDGL